MTAIGLVLRRLWRPTMTTVKTPHVNVRRHFAAHVKWITLYNHRFWAFPEFIITPSLVVKLSTTTAANDDGSGVYFSHRFRSAPDVPDRRTDGRNGGGTVHQSASNTSFCLVISWTQLIFIGQWRDIASPKYRDHSGPTFGAATLYGSWVAQQLRYCAMHSAHTMSCMLWRPVWGNAVASRPWGERLFA